MNDIIMIIQPNFKYYLHPGQPMMSHHHFFISFLLDLESLKLSPKTTRPKIMPGKRKGYFFRNAIAPTTFKYSFYATHIPNHPLVQILTCKLIRMQHFRIHIPSTRVNYTFVQDYAPILTTKFIQLQ